MKIHIWDDELYPYYRYDKHEDAFTGRTVEVDEATLARWDKVIEECEKVQDEMEKLRAQQRYDPEQV